MSVADAIASKSTVTTVTGVSGFGIAKGSEQIQTEFFQNVWAFGLTGIEISWGLGFVLVSLSIVVKLLELTLNGLKVKREITSGD